MQANIAAIREQYPEIVSGDQLCRICHISKLKARWLLENGIIPLRGHRPENPALPHPAGGRARAAHRLDHLSQAVDAPAHLHRRQGESVSDKSLARRAGCPDLWPGGGSVRLHPCTIGRWIKAGKLTAVWYYTRYQIQKSALIEWLAVMGVQQPQRLCERHRKLLYAAGTWRF